MPSKISVNMDGKTILSLTTTDTAFQLREWEINHSIISNTYMKSIFSNLNIIVCYRYLSIMLITSFKIM